MHDVAFTDKIANGITPIKLAHLNRDSRENTKEIENYTKAMAREKKSHESCKMCGIQGSVAVLFSLSKLENESKVFSIFLNALQVHSVQHVW